MNEKLQPDTPLRKKQEVDFLDSIYNPIVLHADGRIGELEERVVERVAVKRHAETGRELRRTVQAKELAEKAVYATLAEYVAARRQTRRSKSEQETDEWEVSPDDEGWKAYEAWRDTYDGPSITDVTIRAHEMAERSWRSDGNETISCDKCPEEAHYACRLTGWSREIYQYPLVRYVDEAGQKYDVPINIADLISARARNRQSPLEIKTTHKFGSDGSLTGMKCLSLDLSSIPRAYAAGRPAVGDVKIDPSEPLAEGVNILIDTWTENEKVANMVRHRHSLGGNPLTADGIIERLQHIVAQGMYHERVESIDYDERLNELRAKVGKLGLALTYEIRYAGMGESDASFALTRPEYGYAPMTRLSYSMDARDGIDESLEFLSKHEPIQRDTSRNRDIE